MRVSVHHFMLSPTVSLTLISSRRTQQGLGLGFRRQETKLKTTTLFDVLCGLLLLMVCAQNRISATILTTTQ